MIRLTMIGDDELCLVDSINPTSVVFVHILRSRINRNEQNDGVNGKSN